MARLLVIALIAVFASSAYAQTRTCHQTCNRVGNQTFCTQTCN